MIPPELNLNHLPQNSIQTEKQEPCNCPCEEGCQSVGYQYANVSVPIELKPNITMGKIETVCCGEPVAECSQDKCGNTCEITLTQKICIKIPVKYNTTACVGEAKTDCICNGDCCK